MKFIKLTIVYFCILISNNIYANKFNAQYNLDNHYNLDNQLSQDSITNNCENIKLTDPTKYISCKLQIYKSIALSIIPFITKTKDVKNSLKEQIPGNLLRSNHNISSDLCKQYSLTLPAGTKVNWQLHGPNEHAHNDCSKEEGHWHYRILNKIPNTNKCKANKSGRYYVCGSDKPAEYNTYWWYLDEY